MLASGAALLSGALPWVTVSLRDGGTTEVSGAAAAPAGSGLALAGLALAGALTLSPTVVRVLLGAVQALLGVGIVATALPALLDPAGRSESTVSALTGVAGSRSVQALIEAADPTVWPTVTAAAGVAAALSGMAVLVTARRWPRAGARYGARGAPTAVRSPADDWDALSGGADPTRDAD
ncbi:MAG: hypothetical protein JWP66_843 [Naasia sp.]|nr:hypothetical protein [Naasia sp.]